MRLDDVKLGKKPARAASATFALEKYVDLSAVPTPPPTFGNYNLVNPWHMYKNDVLSCCVFASYAHGTKLMNAEAGHPVHITNDDVISDYSAVTGYTPSDPKTDDGTDMGEAAEFRRKVGTLGNGKRHTVDSYVSVKAGDVEQLARAVYLFGPCDLGFEVPTYLDAILKHNLPWDYQFQNQAKFDGGHCITIVGRNEHNNFVIVSWGQLYEVTTKFIQAYNDETFAYISLERLKDGSSPEHIDLATLQKDLQLLGS
jgi:hypothetical protein